MPGYPGGTRIKTATSMAYAPTVLAPQLNFEAREDNNAELREDNSYELREFQSPTGD